MNSHEGAREENMQCVHVKDPFGTHGVPGVCLVCAYLRSVAAWCVHGVCVCMCLVCMPGLCLVRAFYVPRVSLVLALCAPCAWCWFASAYVPP